MIQARTNLSLQQNKTKYKNVIFTNNCTIFRNPMRVPTICLKIMVGQHVLLFIQHQINQKFEYPYQW